MVKSRHKTKGKYGNWQYQGKNRKTGNHRDGPDLVEAFPMKSLVKPGCI